MSQRMFPEDCTTGEVVAINALKRLAKVWPHTLRLYSWSGTLVVVDLTKGDSGRCVTSDINDCFMHTIGGTGRFNISNDGGEPDGEAE